LQMGKELGGGGYGGYGGFGGGDDFHLSEPLGQNLYGLNVQFLQSLGIKGPLACKVFVANLDYKVDDKLLRDVMKLAGKVAEIDFLRDKDGKSKGMALVEFTHPVEAVQAISMFHQQTLNDRPMSVRMDALVNEEPPQPHRGTRLPPGLKSIGMGLGNNGEPLKDVTSGQFARTCTEPYGYDGGRDGYGGGYPRDGGFGGGRDGYSNGRDGYGMGRDGFGGNGYDNGFGGRMDGIMVRNLPGYMDWSGLKEVFAQYGEIVYCEIQGRGCGIIKYATEAQAARACKLADRQRLGSSVLEVGPYNSHY